MTDKLTRNERRAFNELVAFYTPRSDENSLRSREVIALVLGISGERVRQIEVAALEKIRRRLHPDWRDMARDLAANGPSGSTLNIPRRG